MAVSQGEAGSDATKERASAPGGPVAEVYQEITDLLRVHGPSGFAVTPEDVRVAEPTSMTDR